MLLFLMNLKMAGGTPPPEVIRDRDEDRGFKTSNRYSERPNPNYLKKWK